MLLLESSVAAGFGASEEASFFGGKASAFFCLPLPPADGWCDSSMLSEEKLRDAAG